MIANGEGIIGRRDHDARGVGSSIRKSRWVGVHPLKMSDPVLVEGDCWIDFGAVALSGIRIGRSGVRDRPRFSCLAGLRVSAASPTWE